MAVHDTQVLPSKSYAEFSMTTAGKTAVVNSSGTDGRRYLYRQNPTSRVNVYREVSILLPGTTGLPNSSSSEKTLAIDGRNLVVATSGTIYGNFAKIINAVIFLDLEQTPPLSALHGKQHAKRKKNQSHARFRTVRPLWWLPWFELVEVKRRPAKKKKRSRSRVVVPLVSGHDIVVPVDVGALVFTGLVPTLLQEHGTFHLALSDQIAFTDVFAESSTRNKRTAFNTSDTLLMQDPKIVKKTSLTRLEVVSLVETFLRPPQSRAYSDAIPLIETFNRGTPRSFQDSVSLTDSESRNLAKLFGESVNLQEVFTPSSGFNAPTFTDSITMLQQFTRERQRAVSDLVSLVDTPLTHRFTYNPALSDVISLIDVVTRKMTRAMLEAVSLIDSLIANRFYTRASSDALTVVDSISKDANKVGSDFITLVSSLSTLANRSIDLSDSDTLSDDFLKSLIMPLDDLAFLIESFIDSAQRTLDFSDSDFLDEEFLTSQTHDVDDSIDLVDVDVAFVRTYNELLIEIMNLVETFTTGRQNALVFQENTVLIDFVENDLERQVSDFMALSDSLDSKEIQRVFEEFVDVEEEFLKIVAMELDELIDVVDDVSCNGTFSREFVESILMQETWFVNNLTALGLIDTIAWDSIFTVVETFSFSESRSVSDQLTVLDSETFNTVHFRVLDDFPMFSDSLEKFAYKEFDDLTTLVEASYRTIGTEFDELVSFVESFEADSSKIFQDALVVVDDWSYNFQGSLQFQEGLFLVDSISKEFPEEFDETLSLSELIVVLPRKNLVETISFAEELDRLWGKNLADSCPLVDLFSRSAIFSRTMTDVVTTSDVFARSRFADLEFDEVASLVEAIKMRTFHNFFDAILISDPSSKLSSRQLFDASMPLDLLNIEALQDQRLVSDAIIAIDEMAFELMREFDDNIVCRAGLSLDDRPRKYVDIRR